MAVSAVFLDRDGTIVEDGPYLQDPAKVVFKPRIFEALRRLIEAKFILIIVTNQSGIGRGYFSENDFWQVQQFIVDALQAQGVVITDTYYCPHHPEHAQDPYRMVCDCRKPQPGMLSRAMADYQIDPASSFMVGDQLTDMQAGYRAGLACIRVHSDGIADESYRVATDVYDALSYML